MLFPGQTLGGASDGKQKKFLSTFNDDPYQKYMQQMNIQPNQDNVNINASVATPNPGGDGTFSSGGPDGPNDSGGGTDPVPENYYGNGGNSGVKQSPGKRDAPTIDELMNMSPEEIANIFARGVPTDRFLDMYGQYIPEYDQYQEQQREKEYGLTTSGMRDEASIGKERIEGQFRSMASNFGEDKMKDRLVGAMSNQFDLANIGKKQDIRGLQEGYYSDVMESMRYLGEQGAFDPASYERGDERGGETNTSEWADGVNIGDTHVTHGHNGRTWYWNGTEWTINNPNVIVRGGN